MYYNVYWPLKYIIVKLTDYMYKQDGPSLESSYLNVTLR